MCVELVGRVLEVDARTGDVILDVAGRARRASLALLILDAAEPIEPGAWVVVHTGFVTGRIDEVEALRLMDEQAAIRGLEEVGS